jgi:tRNA modification GTPase
MSIDMDEALAALGEITGETTPDEVLGEIFGSFCIGK